MDPQTTFCEIELSTELMPVLGDHRVDGAIVVPAAVLLELVLSAAAATYGLTRGDDERRFPTITCDVGGCR